MVYFKELTRFPNHIIETGGHCYWDIYALYNEIIRGLKVVAKDNLPIPLFSDLHPQIRGDNRVEPKC